MAARGERGRGSWVRRGRDVVMGGGKDGGQSKEGWRERKEGCPTARRRGGGGALRLRPFNETVIYASPRNHKT